MTRSGSRSSRAGRSRRSQGVLAAMLSVTAAVFASRLAAQTTAGPAGADWRSYAGDLRNHHYSPLDQINAANFSALEVAWRFKTDSLGPRPEFKLEGTPLVV